MKVMFSIVTIIFFALVIAYLRIAQFADAGLHLAIWFVLSIIYRRELEE